MQENYFHHHLYSSYNNFRETSLSNRWIRHTDILPLIENIKRSSIFSVEKAGVSTEKRDIFVISAGHGKTKIIFWSQMHGDESTATMAIFDLLNFLKAEDGFNSIRERILNNTTLHFIPMLNPDGAEIFQRRNAQNIDINRDALSLQSPEAKILSSLVDKIKPDFGFNLHDQSSRYSSGRSSRSAAFSFLAPPFDEVKSINDTRLRSIKLISRLNKIISNFIPGHTARYKDNFEPRAFGDNIQSRGTSTILIETGKWKEDLEKQYLRKLNFVTFLSAINTICCETYNEENLNDYYSIPENEELLFDLILRNVNMFNDQINYKVDIGINLYEYGEKNRIRYKGLIEDLGDLTGFFGCEELDGTGMTAEPGKTYPNILKSIDEISKLDFSRLYKDGITSVVISKKNNMSEFIDFPIIVKYNKNSMNKIKTGSPAQFILYKNNAIRFLIINGFLYDTVTATNKITNGIIIM